VTTFWEVYEPFDGPGLYLGAIDKQRMIDNGLPFEVTSISEGEGQYGPEFNCTIQSPDPETDGGHVAKVLSLKIGYEGRDHKLRAMSDWLESHYPETVLCRLVKVGRMHDLADGRDAQEPRGDEAWMDWNAEVTA
jgi:hypothetical protein